MTQDEMHQQKIRETIAYAQRAKVMQAEEADAAIQAVISAAQGYGTNTTSGSGYGTTAINTASAVNSSNRNYGQTASTSGWSDDKVEAPSLSQSSDLPNISLTTWDENENEIVLTLKPEGNISAADSLKLVMLVMAVSAAPYEFSALAYVKRNNLERHFTYS